MVQIRQTVTRARERPQSYATDPTADTATLQYQRSFKCAKVNIPVQARAANSFLLAWQNPESNKIIVHEVIIRITAAGGTATSVLNVGPATSATGTSDTIYDGLDLNATGVYSSHNVSDTGTNGNEKPHVLDENGGTTPYLTGKILVEKADTLAGDIYIFYTEI